MVSRRRCCCKEESNSSISMSGDSSGSSKSLTPDLVCIAGCSSSIVPARWKLTASGFSGTPPWVCCSQWNGVFFLRHCGSCTWVSDEEGGECHNEHPLGIATAKWVLFIGLSFGPPFGGVMRVHRADEQEYCGINDDFTNLYIKDNPNCLGPNTLTKLVSGACDTEPNTIFVEPA